MPRTSPDQVPYPKAPAHLWVVGLVSLLWNVWGAYIALSAQSGTLPNLRAEDQAYFASQPLWFVIVADSALVAGIAGAIALLLLHRSAVWLYAAEVAILILANAYDLAAGTSPMLSNPTSVGGSGFLLAILALQAWYAVRMHKRGVLE